MYHGGYEGLGKGLANYASDIVQKGVEMKVEEIRSALNGKEE